MKLFGDYHTHTFYSDGVSSIEENVISAVNKGLKQVAITDHSFSHMAHGINKKTYAEQTQIINELRAKYPEIEILHGVESNLTGLDGSIDVSPEFRHEFDVLVVGYHYTYKPNGFKNFFNFWLPSVLHLNTKAKIEKNTNAYIKAIENNQVDIVAHLGYGIKVDPVKIAEVAAKHETYIELNAKHLLFTDSQMLEMVKTGVKFIINSDAHHFSGVGKNNVAYALIERLNIPHSQVVNLLDVPKFKNYNLNKKY